MLMEEIFAVRSSLLYVLEEGLIELNDLPLQIRAYKSGYGKYIRGYAATYDTFDFVARGIGETAPFAIIYTALGTLNPQFAFVDILARLTQFDTSASNNLVWRITKEQRNYLADLSFKEVRDVFHMFLSEGDPDGSLYARSELLDYTKKIVEQFHDASQNIKTILLRRYMTH